MIRTLLDKQILKITFSYNYLPVIFSDVDEKRNHFVACYFRARTIEPEFESFDKRNPPIFESWFLSHTFEIMVPESSKLYISDRCFLTIPNLFPRNLEILEYWKFQGFIIVSSANTQFSSDLLRLCTLLRSIRVISNWCPVQAHSVVHKRELVATQQRTEKKWTGRQLSKEHLFPSLMKDWNHFSKYLITILKPLIDRSRRKLRYTDDFINANKTVQIPVQTTN